MLVRTCRPQTRLSWDTDSGEVINTQMLTEVTRVDDVCTGKRRVRTEPQGTPTLQRWAEKGQHLKKARRSRQKGSRKTTQLPGRDRCGVSTAPTSKRQAELLPQSSESKNRALGGGSHTGQEATDRRESLARLCVCFCSC